MYVTSLYAKSDFNVIDIMNPTWKQIENTILALDGWQLNTMTIGKEYEEEERKDETRDFMTIAGGGENKLYLCHIYSYESQYSEIMLYDPFKSWDEKIEIVNTFPEIYSAIRCVNLDSILVAAETYSRFGRRDKSLHWGYISKDLEKFSNTSPQFRIIEVK